MVLDRGDSQRAALHRDFLASAALSRGNPAVFLYWDGRIRLVRLGQKPGEPRQADYDLAMALSSQVLRRITHTFVATGVDDDALDRCSGSFYRRGDNGFGIARYVAGRTKNSGELAVLDRD